MPKRSLGQHLDIWGRLVEAAMNNIRDLPAAREAVEILKQALGEIRELKQRQIELRAAAQQYGSQSEKLTEYGLRPWRPRRRKAAPEGPQAGDSAAPTEKKPRKPRRRRKS
jgi:hypothetical protein